jgi:hypothetical protein
MSNAPVGWVTVVRVLDRSKAACPCRWPLALRVRDGLSKLRLICYYTEKGWRSGLGPLSRLRTRNRPEHQRAKGSLWRVLSSVSYN